MGRPVLHWAVDSVNPILPLAVAGAEWAGESLTIWGDHWSFSTMSSWRMTSAGAFAASSVHRPEAAAALLRGNVLRRMGIRPGIATDDLTLVFERDVIVEVFSDMQVEPWVLRVGDTIYVPPYLGA